MTLEFIAAIAIATTFTTLSYLCHVLTRKFFVCASGKLSRPFLRDL